MTKRWSSTRRDLTMTKRQASKAQRRYEIEDDEIERNVMPDPDVPNASDKTTAPQVVGPDPADVEAVARVISSEIGYPYDTLYEDKRDWIAGRGRRYDVNVPYKSDLRYAAKAAIAALVERGWAKKENVNED